MRVHSGRLFVALVGWLLVAVCAGCDGSSVIGRVGDGAVSTMDATLDVQCAAPEVACGGRCVDTQSQREHCGACGNACPADQVCTLGRCAFSCPTGQQVCNGACVTLRTDRQHCGACGNACPAGLLCSEGQCQRECGPGLALCASGDPGGVDGGRDAVCADVRVDRAHCGACGNACPSGQICAMGRCVLSCAAPLSECMGACRDLGADNDHCGACGTACPAGQLCSMGRCAVTCGGGTTNCAGTCRDLSTDNGHCGACGMACPSGQVCSAGACAVSCASGFTNCGGTCRDLSSDNGHCGACGMACPSGQVCSAGACAVSCAAGFTNCGGTCRDLANDRSHCGACGMACPSGQVCAAGACAVSCTAGLTACGSTCRDTQTDRLHCGACDRACAAGEVCTAGRCVVSCVVGQTECAGACRDLSTDNGHCGACGRACAAGQLCSGGTCAVSCGAGLTVCAGTCRDLSTDNGHCGACGRACAAGEVCSAGACSVSCGAGLTVCSGTCRDLSSDNGHCGACGRVCPSGQVCAAGACTVTCGAGFTNCSGACQNLTSDRQHCGACGNACPEGQRCTAGRCAVSCVVGQTECAGACRDLTTDNGHCGACGRACAAGQLCSGGACNVSCGAGLTECAGTCRDLSTDTRHCGRCGASCPAGQVCSGGVCNVSCAAGFTNCAGTCRDLSTDNGHCGACGRVCPSGQVCSAGACAVTCAAGFTACAGACRDLRDDRLNCGACGMACASGQVCAAGRCVVSCPGGQTECSGTCRDLSTDNRHCGACGMACGAGTVCSGGRCGTTCGAGLTDCSGTCTNLSTDNASCGACGRACGAGTVCSAGACTASCGAGATNCGGSCVSLSNDPNHCGACGTVCPRPANAVAVCAASRCAFICNADAWRVGGACVLVNAPRPIAPASTSTVTSRRPTLRWVLSGGDGARVELCRDRALTQRCVTFDVVGTSGAPATDLAPGVWFWRLTAQNGGVTTRAAGPTWQFTVGERSAPINTSWGTTLDVNGDGYADVVVGAYGSSTAYVYQGGATGLAPTPSVLSGPAGSNNFGISVASAGDVNGDGYADLVVGADTSNTAYVYLGGATGLSTTPTILTGPAGSNAFGRPVTSAGDVNGDGYADLVVGAPVSNTAYVYFGGATGLATTPTTLTGPAGSNAFGVSVASAGDVNGDGYADLVVGASASNTAYVYLGGATGLATTPATLAGPAGSRFGQSVASAGDVNGDGYADLVVGAFGSNTAYVYLGGATGVATTPTTLTGPAGSSYFGYSVASAGDVNGDGYADVVVGASVSNAAYVYLGGATGLATTPTTLTGPAGSGAFSASVASAGDVNGDGYADLIVGAFISNSAYVYLGGATGLATTPITLTGPAESQIFGRSVASAGDVNRDGYADLIVGANGSNTAYVYLGGATGLSSTPTTLTRPVGSAGFGESVASAGDVNGDGYADVVVGAGGSNTAYVYLGGATGLATTPTTLRGPAGSSYFGLSVASAGDVNRDGYADLVVGAFGSNTAYVYLGGATGLATTPTTLTGPAGSTSFGRSVASAGDVNGDGYADVVVGAYTSNTAYVYLGGATGLATTPTTLTGPAGSNYFGVSVASAGDVNRDGYADLVVGAYASNTAYMYLGGATGLATTPTTLTGPAGSNYFGNSVASAGDVNGDGYADVVVGGSNSNTVYVYLGGATGLATMPTTLTRPTGSDSFGVSVASTGDVNRDGYADVVVGASSSNTAYVYLGGATGLATTPTTFRGPGSRGFGVSVASAGGVTSRSRLAGVGTQHRRCGERSGRA
jgi:hypothetical protein